MLTVSFKAYALLPAFIGLVWSQATCPPGFSGGPECAICQSDAACAVSTGVASATCDNSPQYSANSTTKSYSCNVAGPDLLNGLLVPGSLLIRCHTGLGGFHPPATPPTSLPPPPPPPPPPPLPPQPAPEAAPPLAPSVPPAAAGAPVPFGAAPPSPVLLPTGNQIADGPGPTPLPAGRRLLQQAPAAEAAPSAASCDISFVVQDPLVKVGCRATDCAIPQPGAADPTVSCSASSCACPDDATCNGSALIAGLAGSVAGEVSLKCAVGGNCSLVLTGLPVRSIEATCSIGECLLPTQLQFNGTNSTKAVASLPPPVPYLNPLIAGIPAIILTLVVGFVGAYTLANRSLWQYTIRPADAAAAAKLAAAPSMARKVASLEFRGLSVNVPMASRAREKKAAALRARALPRTESERLLQERAQKRQAASLLQRLVAGGKRVGGASAGGAALGPPQPAPEPGRGVSQEEALAAAEFVVGLHDGGSPGEWCILRGCSGTAHGGEVVGVLGPSGCGKTTLLGAIAGAATEMGRNVRMEGRVLVDGAPRRERDVAYVPQADHLIPTLTVQECIRYSAMLRLPRSTQPLDVQLRVERILAELGLRHVADSQVGGLGNIRGVSGGERRRVTIGMELVTDPSILVLDEPTSGLDSYTAISLVRSLRQVAAGGRVVIASLHQPSRDMFYSLDRVALMGHGRMLYMGRPEEAEAAFAAAGVPCPPGTATAEHMLKVASSPEDIRRALQAGLAGGARLGEHGAGGREGSVRSARSVLGVAPPSAASAGRGGEEAPPPGGGPGPASAPRDQLEAAADGQSGGGAAAASRDSSPASSKSSSPAPVPSQALGAAAAPGAAETRAAAAAPALALPGFSRQLAVMFWRTLLDIVRNPTLLLLHVVIAALVGTTVGGIYWHLHEDSVGVQNRMGGTFFAMAFLAFTSLTTVDLLMAERQVVEREVRGGYYSPQAYLLSKLALDGMLLRVLPALLFWAPYYYMAGFRKGISYAATYALTLVAFNCAIGALSMAVTVASATAGQSAFLMNFILLFSLVFTGFLVNVSSIPAVLRWIHYLSVWYYAFEAMMTNELNGLTFEFLYQPAPGKAPVRVPDITGETFLSSLGFITTNTTLDIGILVAMYGAFVLLALAFFLMRLPRAASSGCGGWLRRGKVYSRPRHESPAK